MKVLELFSEARNTLQDNDKNYWDDSELLAYYNECVRSMSAERLENKTTATLVLEAGKNLYDTTGVLRYIRAVDNEGTARELYPDDETGEEDNLGIIVKDYNKIYINDETQGSSITLSIVAMPESSNLTSLVRIGDESAVKYYILSKSYEKDSDMENFQKSDYFFKRYMEEFKKLKESSSVNYRIFNKDNTQAYYY